MTTIFAFQAPKHGSDLEEEFKERDTHSIVWSSAHPPLRTAVPELGWVEKGVLGSSHAESDYATTAYLCCCGALLGNDLDDVVWIDWFWSDIALRRIFVAQTKLGLTLRGTGWASLRAWQRCKPLRRVRKEPIGRASRSALVTSWSHRGQ